MTVPRQVLPGATYLVTRRCAQRQLLLRPSEHTNAVVLYVLALASRRFGVEVHAFCVMSNHFHLVVTDPEARLPQFVQYLASLVARALNAAHGRWEAFWAPGSYSAVRLVSAEDIVAKGAYVLGNPVAAGLVKCAREWPGLWMTPQQAGSPISAARPTDFFRAAGALPDSMDLPLTIPPGFASADEFRSRLVEALATLEERSREDLRAARRQFLGAAGALSQDPSSKPRSPERRRGLNPRVAALDRWKRVEALGRLKEFVRAYRDAWRKLRAGVRDVVFPAGTYLLRVLHGVRCAEIS